MQVTNPSRPETFPQVWRGTAGGGRGLTVEQVDTVRRDWKHPAAVDLIAVDGVGGRYVCPCLATTRDKQRMLVVTPNGEKMWLPRGLALAPPTDNKD